MDKTQEFFTAYEELFEAYKASDGADTAYARMVGSLKIIVSFTVDRENLVKLSQELQKATQNETMKILIKEDIHA